jgi:hypothetical protein
MIGAVGGCGTLDSIRSVLAAVTVVGGWPPHNYFSELLFAGYIAVTSDVSWSCGIHQTTYLLFQPTTAPTIVFQANYDFGACSCALAAGPTLSLSLYHAPAASPT